MNPAGGGPTQKPEGLATPSVVNANGLAVFPLARNQVKLSRFFQREAALAARS
jgi:hypothetical protein